MPGLRPPNLQPDVNGDEYDEVYIVHKGDSLGSIAAAQGVGLSELLAHNPAITDPNLISIGQLLAVPHAMKSNLGTVTRVVAPTTNGNPLWLAFVDYHNGALRFDDCRVALADVGVEDL